MSEAFAIALMNLVSRVGFDAAIALLQRLQKATTIDDAIQAMHAAKSMTWTDFKAETKPPSP